MLANVGQQIASVGQICPFFINSGPNWPVFRRKWRQHYSMKNATSGSNFGEDAIWRGPQPVWASAVKIRSLGAHFRLKFRTTPALDCGPVAMPSLERADPTKVPNQKARTMPVLIKSSRTLAQMRAPGSSRRSARKTPLREFRSQQDISHPRPSSCKI